MFDFGIGKTKMENIQPISTKIQEDYQQIHDILNQLSTKKTPLEIGFLINKIILINRAYLNKKISIFDSINITGNEESKNESKEPTRSTSLLNKKFDEWSYLVFPKIHKGLIDDCYNAGFILSKDEEGIIFDMLDYEDTVVYHNKPEETSLIPLFFCKYSMNTFLILPFLLAKKQESKTQMIYRLGIEFCFKNWNRDEIEELSESWLNRNILLFFGFYHLFWCPLFKDESIDRKLSRLLILLNMILRGEVVLRIRRGKSLEGTNERWKIIETFFQSLFYFSKRYEKLAVSANQLCELLNELEKIYLIGVEKTITHEDQKIFDCISLLFKQHYLDENVKQYVDDKLDDYLKISHSECSPINHILIEILVSGESLKENYPSGLLLDQEKEIFKEINKRMELLENIQQKFLANSSFYKNKAITLQHIACDQHPKTVDGFLSNKKKIVSSDKDMGSKIFVETILESEDGEEKIDNGRDKESFYLNETIKEDRNKENLVGNKDGDSLSSNHVFLEDALDECSKHNHCEREYKFLEDRLEDCLQYSPPSEKETFEKEKVLPEKRFIVEEEGENLNQAKRNCHSSYRYEKQTTENPPELNNQLKKENELDDQNSFNEKNTETSFGDLEDKDSSLENFDDHQRIFPGDKDIIEDKNNIQLSTIQEPIDIESGGYMENDNKPNEDNSHIGDNTHLEFPLFDKGEGEEEERTEKKYEEVPFNTEESFFGTNGKYLNRVEDENDLYDVDLEEHDGSDEREYQNNEENIDMKEDNLTESSNSDLSIEFESKTSKAHALDIYSDGIF